MLLLHQVGSLKIGEVVRYTVTYTPSADRILPSPECLFLRIKNTCAIALRAAFVHGPYNLSVAAYPSHFNPNEKFENPRRYGVPEFEPMLKAGGVWNCHLVVPDNIRQSAGEGSSKHGQFGKGPEHDGESVSWVIEVASQVIFSVSAAVHYEILLARDEKSLSLGSVMPVIGGQAQVPQPGKISDFQPSIHGHSPEHHGHHKGVFSRAIKLRVEDTAALWNKPELPGWEDSGHLRLRNRGKDGLMDPPATTKNTEGPQPTKKQKKVHLVVLTHGLHSNLGADMLYIKESIDAGVKKAKADARARRAKERASRADTPSSGSDQHEQNRRDTTVVDVAEDSDDDEEVAVRGFAGNATKTEKGIKYLGKRLANFILSMTYPDQPCLPLAKAAAEAIASRLSPKPEGEEKRAHKHSTIYEVPHTEPKRRYKITKISFIAHSLGGLVQTYAIAYIQKHSPQFFDLIEPINFIALASPLLGLNHENPLYVKFALDFGLVGRTGQDLGLTWRAPTIARSGWGAIVGNLGENAHRRVYGETQPESKPLLRILPTGPAHKALKKFRNRTLYSNVVNDGIVPTRTSCLLFLDWQGLGRVEKARREAGLVETVVGFGWAELTGANVMSPRIGPWLPEEGQDKDKDDSDNSGGTTPSSLNASHEVPQPSRNATLEDDRQSLRSVTSPYLQPEGTDVQNLQTSTTNNGNRLSGFFNFFRSEGWQTPPAPTAKQMKIYQRSQTLKSSSSSEPDSAASSKSKVTAGTELDDSEGVSAPPRTTFFESAGDLLNPKLPSLEYLIDPSKRPRTIFHDRVYHPSDIPPPPMKKRAGNSLRKKTNPRTNTTATESCSTSATTKSEPVSGSPPRSLVASPVLDPTLSVRKDSDISRLSADTADDEIDSSQMRVEEKIARAYHCELSWRKVLVKLEPDAHNNIIVRRMFANAFGWPVVQHLVEAHFSDSATARMRDEDESGKERAKGLDKPPDKHGLETKGSQSGSGEGTGETAEEMDAVGKLPSGENALGVFEVTRRPSTNRPRVVRVDSMTWSERDWADSGEDSSDVDQEDRGSSEAKKKSVPAEGKAGQWNWTEKIVGKGAVRRSMSPRTMTGDSVLKVQVPEEDEGQVETPTGPAKGVLRVEVPPASPGDDDDQTPTVKTPPAEVNEQDGKTTT